MCTAVLQTMHHEQASAYAWPQLVRARAADVRPFENTSQRTEGAPGTQDVANLQAEPLRGDTREPRVACEHPPSAVGNQHR